jgi:Na+/proline symporter
MASSIRGMAWRTGGMILLAMGAVSLAVTIGSLTLTGGGVILLPLALPPLAGGYMVLRATPGARVVGSAVGAIYGGFVWYFFATYPLRGLAPAPGQSDPRQIDIVSALVACVFLTAAVTILVGRARRQASDR